MNICLYGASSNTIAKSYIAETEELGEKLAKRGHNLVFGGGANGLMGAAARGVLRGGGKIIGVAPSFLNVDGILFKDCTELIYTSTMRERKEAMENNADAFVVVPGGPGTFDEFFEIYTLKQLGRHSKPIAVYNENGYFDELNAMLDKAVCRHFMTDASRTLYASFVNPDKLLCYLEDYSGEAVNLKIMKNITD